MEGEQNITSSNPKPERGPLSLEEIQEATDERLDQIQKEFSEGFNFLKKFPKSVTFFGSARFKEGNTYYDKARNLSQRIVKDLGYSIITGGGPGIMEAANRGASEAGGESVGLTIKLPKAQVTNDYLTDNMNFYYFFSRKVCLTYSAETFLIFPGGFGTLDEFFEIVTLLQTNKIPPIPIVLVGEKFWRPIEDTIKKELLERGTINEKELGLFTITDDEEKILEIIKNAPVRTSIPYTNGQK